MQAVVIIHGMGEQTPMNTLNGFVKTVWNDDPDLLNPSKPDPIDGGRHEKNASWAKPDDFSESFELRRITTESSLQNRRTDFFEFYWAHHINDTTPRQLLSWIWTLLFRNPFRNVPPRIMHVWILLWLFTIAVSFSLLYPVLVSNNLLKIHIDKVWYWSILSFGALSWYLISRILVKSFGDVARYVRAKPHNIHVRQTVRREGVRLLEKILDAKDPDTNEFVYDRIMVVAHSLGTIVAYDILTHSFAKRSREFRNCENPSLEPERAKLEAMVRQALDAGALNIDEYQKQQDAARHEKVKNGMRWVVSDFITLGSPLTHAEFLLAETKEHLHELQAKRVLPTAPPSLEFDRRTKNQHFTYRHGRVTRHYLSNQSGSDAQKRKLEVNLKTPRTPHHAALFAYTRWTNLYSPHRWILWGDLISGPLSSQFGNATNRSKVISGIKDIQVMPTTSNGRAPFLSHTKYWNQTIRSGTQDDETVAEHIAILRQALRLDG